MEAPAEGSWEKVRGGGRQGGGGKREKAGGSLGRESAVQKRHFLRRWM